jgi:hypothetical protein
MNTDGIIPLCYKTAAAFSLPAYQAAQGNIICLERGRVPSIDSQHSVTLFLPCGD